MKDKAMTLIVLFLIAFMFLLAGQGFLTIGDPEHYGTFIGLLNDLTNKLAANFDLLVGVMLGLSIPKE